ncbi:MAG: NAD(P)-dependent oxidoreductase [Aquabacterium sp.]|nr:NAD(P)-dependent oxidoreductase [Aquabacterium sp.]
MSTIAFLGTGLLGSAFAEAASKRGDTVTAWNRSVEKAQALVPFGVTVAANPAEAVRHAQRVHIVLKDDASVDEVLAATRAGLLPDAIIIDHTTTLPTLTAARAQRLKAEGVKYLHCPVFMGPAAARNAQGTMMVAGPGEYFESVKADLQKMTHRLEYMGERTDLAAVNKLFGNAMILGVAAVMADVFTMAQASDVCGEDALKLFGFFDLNAVASGRGANMAKGDFEPSFELTMARKDIGLMLETAGDRPMATLPGIAARMDQLIAAGYGAKDCSVIGIDAVQRRE